MSFLPFPVTSIQKYSGSWFINNITNWRELVFLEILLFQQDIDKGTQIFKQFHKMCPFYLFYCTWAGFLWKTWFCIIFQFKIIHTKHSYFGSCFSIHYFWSYLKLVLFLTIIMETVIFIVWRLCPFLSFFLPGAENPSFKYTSKLQTIEI